MTQLLCGAVLFLASPAFGQQAPASPSDDAKRIEQMRDKAAAGFSEPATSPASPEQPSADRAAAEAIEPGEAAAAQATKDVPLPANEALPLGAGEGDLFGGQSEQSSSGTMGDGWLLSTLAALGVVLAMVFGIRWLLRRGGVVSAAAPQGGVVEVLSRTTVAPRSHVVLLRVGTRILVVSDSTTGMRTLASVHEAEEVAELLGAIDSAKATSMSQSFGSVMKKLSGQWSGDEEEQIHPSETAASDSSPSVDQAQGALSRVRGRLAALSDTRGQA